MLRFGEHNIASLRRELHAAVDEERNKCSADKDIRKQLLDKVLCSILQIINMEDYISKEKDILKEMNEFLNTNNQRVEKMCGVNGKLERK